MPAICDSITSKLSENLSQSFKKSEKESFENHLTPTAKQVLSAKIDYEPVPSYSNAILNTLQTKYIVLKPNQAALSSNGNTPKSQQNTNGKHHSATTNGSSTSSLNQLPPPRKVFFSRDNVHVGWNSIGRNWSSGCGFHNVGNTCYLNSTLQAFFHVPALAQWLVNDKEHREKGNCHTYQQCIICAMAQTLISTQRQQHAITPSLITQRLHNICKHLTLGRQEDAHEFLRYLVEQMEKSFLNRFKGTPGFKDLDQYSKETTPLNQILGGYLRSTVTCLACKHESITFQHFEDLQLDISRVSTLNEALGGYFARENLEECGYKCESCKKKVSATKRFTLERAPTVLCIQLKRFNVMGGKLGKPIQICQNLDLQKHLAKSGEPNQSCHYKLVSMVTHLGGSASGGHYTAIGLAPNGNFYQFDDSCVSTISTESVLRTNAYVLFFELVSLKPKQNGHSFAIHQNEHAYSKIPSSTSTSPSPSSYRNENFAKPVLPKMLPPAIMRQNQLRQKENETTPPSSRTIPSTSRASGVLNGVCKVVTQLFPSLKANGKREASDDEGDSEQVLAKKLKPSLPSLPRLTSEESPTNGSATVTPTKPKSLVPYGSDDEDDESTTNGKKAEADRVNFCRTSSGVFVETDLKENSRPSKQGATVDKTVVTKASLTNGSAVNGQANGTKSLSNGNHVKRTDDALQQLSKLNHSGYGTSEIVSWNNTPASMNREVDKDQHEERKRQLEDDEELEMDSGRVKKVKYNNRYSGPHQGKLPNPFQEQQNALNQNGNYRQHQPIYYNQDRVSNNNFNRNPNQHQNGNIYNRQFGGKQGYKQGGYKQRDNYGYQNGHNRHNNGKFNKNYYNNNNRR